MRTQCRVEEIRPATRSLLIRSFKTGDHYEYEYDSLVIATGASARIPPIANADLNGVFKLRNVEDGEDIRQYLAEAKPQNAVIVGGGYIGLEMAEVLHQQGIKVAIVEMAPHLAPNMDRDMANLQQYLQEQGVRFHRGEGAGSGRGRPSHLNQPDAVRQLVTDCRTLPADLVLLSATVTPNSWLAEKGLALGCSRRSG